MAKRKGSIQNVTDPDGNFLEEVESPLDAELVPSDEETEVDDAPEETEESRNLREEIKRLTSSISSEYWELSEKVHRVNKSRFYKTWGFSKFEDWCEQEFGFQRRKAFNFVQFHDYCTSKLKEVLPSGKYESVVNTLKTVGWSKALEIAQSKVLSTDNVDEILDYAKAENVANFSTKLKLIAAECKKETKKEDDGIKENTVKLIRRSFKFTEFQEELVNAAINKVKEILGEENIRPERGIEYACGEFMSNVSSDIQGSLANLERILGVNIIAIRGHDDVVYGVETLQKLAETEEQKAENLV